MQRFLDPEGLQEPRHRAFRRLGRHLRRSRRHDGDLARTGRRLRPRSRFARFTNLPELQQMFRAFADVQTAEMLNLPRPAAGRRQADRRRLPDVRRAARAPAGAGRPLRAAALAEGRPARGQRPGHHHRRPQARPRRPAALRRRPPDFPDSKINALVEQRRRHLADDRRDARHADDLLRHGRQPDALGLLGL